MGGAESKMQVTGLIGQEQNPLAVFHAVGPGNQMFPPYLYSQPRTLAVKEKGAFSGGEDTFEGIDVHTHAMEFYAQMKFFSMREKKRVYDMTGNQFCEIREQIGWKGKRITVRATGSDLEMARMKRVFGAGQILVWIRHASSTGKDIDERHQPPALKIVKTDTFGFEFDVLRVDGVVANTRRGRDPEPLVARLIQTGRSFNRKDSYRITVAPCVDMGLMMCLVVALDELRNDKERNH